MGSSARGDKAGTKLARAMHGASGGRAQVTGTSPPTWARAATALQTGTEASPEDVTNLPEIPGFEVHERIGQGGMGVVYRATQTSLNRTVALKLLPKDLAERPLFVERFYEETKALSTLNHPNIVTIIDRGNVGKTYYFVMEYVEGVPLSDQIGQKLETAWLLQIAECICKALQYAHARRLVHRDIKPANIMLTRDGGAKVMDFGLVGAIRQSADDGRDSAGKIMGTPGYMSPEQMRGAAVLDGRSDLFSAGIVLYEAATGTRPSRVNPKPPSQICEQADPRLDPVVAKCLALDSEHRHQSAGELLADIVKLRRELQDEPRCPACGIVNPVRSMVCGGCKRDLSNSFDRCPDCGMSNRSDVCDCLRCGVNLARRRAEVREEIEKEFEQAFRLLYDEQYRDAQQVLKQVVNVKGDAFYEARMRAVALVKTIDFGQRRMSKVRFRQGKELLRSGHVLAAINLWEAITPRTEEIATVIESARLHLADTERHRRTRKTIRILLLLVGLMGLLAAAVSYL